MKNGRHWQRCVCGSHLAPTPHWLELHRSRHMPFTHSCVATHGRDDEQPWSGTQPPPDHGLPKKPSKQRHTPWLSELTMHPALSAHHTSAHAVCVCESRSETMVDGKLIVRVFTHVAGGTHVKCSH